MKYSSVAVLVLSGCLAAQAPTLDQLQSRARASAANNDFRAAAAALEQAHKLARRDPRVAYNLALIYAMLGKNDAALALWNEIADLKLGFHPGATRAFAPLAEMKGYAELVERIERNEPKVTRSKAVFTIKEPDLFPEGIACDERDGTLYISSVLKAKVVRIKAGGAVDDFIKSRQDGLCGTLGMKVDSKRHLLWVASSGSPADPATDGKSGLFAFDLATGKTVHKLLLSGAGAFLLNDLALDGSGHVYVTDTDTGAVMRTANEFSSLIEFLPAGTLAGPNGIAFSDDGKYLYVAASGRGIAVVDMSTQRVTTVTPPDGAFVGGIDGLYFHKGALIAVQNGVGLPRIVRYQLASPARIKSDCIARGVPTPIIFRSSSAKLHAAACSRSLFCTFCFPRTYNRRRAPVS